MFKWTYSYDNLGNIETITDNVGNKTVGSYSYDVQNQLTQETYKYRNSSGNWVTVTGTYTYDTAGNILTSSGNGSNITYTYGNSKWQNKLTSIKVGNTTQSISYSGGNPTNWYNGETYTSLTWEKGSQLTSLSHNSDTISYVYDMEGIRTSKTVGGVTHNYVTQNGKVVQESYGNTVMQFVYDTNGNPFALRYTPDSGTTWSTYYYMLNAQGDVVAVTSGGLSVVASYTYDAWGRLVTSSGWMASINPLRYRGYYYDTETGFYYVQSRYYDPIVKRFINADEVSNFAANGEFLSYNLFAYCGNNPINRYDSEGTDWRNVFATGITIATIGIMILATLPFSGPLLAGAGVTTVTVATTANAAVATGLTVAGGSIISAFSKESKKSGKEYASDRPSWANRNSVDTNISAQENASKMLNEKYGAGNWKKGPGTEFNKIVKWITRSIKMLIF